MLGVSCIRDRLEVVGSSVSGVGDGSSGAATKNHGARGQSTET